MTICNDMTLASVEADAGLKAALGMERAAVIGAIRDSGMKAGGAPVFRRVSNGTWPPPPRTA